MNVPSCNLARGDAIAAVVLLLFAFVPVYFGVIRAESATPGTAHRARVLTEIENRGALERGILPWWDPFQFGGRPHLANAETHLWYPPHMVGRLLPRDLFCIVSVAIHAWAAGIGAYLIARQLGAARVASLAGGGAAMLGSVLGPAVDVAHSPDVFRLAWIPLAIAFAMRTTARSSWLPHPGLVVTIALACLTASIRGVFYVLAAVAAWFLFAALWPPASPVAPARRQRLAQLCVAACLVAGVTAVQTVPFGSFLASAPREARFVNDEPDAGGGSDDRRRGRAERVAAVLAPMSRGRVISACGGEIDAALVARRISIVDGHGGAVPEGYARFLNLAGGRFPDRADVYRRLEDAGGEPVRSDLLQLLDADYLVSCGTPDPQRWEPVADVDGAGIFRAADSVGRAVWTCAPRSVSREELEYRLERQRYDSTLTLHDAGPAVHVRWAAAVEDRERERAERAFGLRRERYLGERTWQYELANASAANIAGIVGSHLVEDTAGLDRSRFAPAPLAPAFDDQTKTEWLIGAERCPEIGRAALLSKDREDGRLVAVVDAPREGLVFLSETYSPDRLAWVDGRQVTPLRVNLAFTGIPVPSGPHRIELGYDRSGFQLGAAISAVSLLAWSVCAWRVRSA